MKFEITHLTEYNYTDEVFFEPHYLRFKPKISPYLSLSSFDIRVEPEPAGFSEQLDTENNLIRLYWFEHTHRKLRIAVHSIVEVSDYNPFNFIINPLEYLELPFQYDKATHQLLAPALQSTSLSGATQELLKATLHKSNNHTVNFLIALTRQIHEDFFLESRETGVPYDPNLTFEQKNGSCRDLAWMQAHWLRHMGIAARFVSGYYYIRAENPEFELHAWVEAYLPGAGWIGLDPGHGIMAGSDHIPLASSAFYENTMPVTGSVRGTARTSMNTELNIALIP